jgi:hypothetical protein
VLRTLTKTRPLLFSQGEIYGGFVASQVHVSNYQAGICSEASGELSANSKTAEVKSTEAAPGIVAHSFEFVALPGRVITMWAGSQRSELCGESVNRLQKWLSPYVDHWLRSGRFASFAAVPDRFPGNSSELCEMPLGANCSHLQ